MEHCPSCRATFSDEYLLDYSSLIDPQCPMRLCYKCFIKEFDGRLDNQRITLDDSNYVSTLDRVSTTLGLQHYKFVKIYQPSMHIVAVPEDEDELMETDQEVPGNYTNGNQWSFDISVNKSCSNCCDEYPSEHFLPCPRNNQRCEHRVCYRCFLLYYGGKILLRCLYCLNPIQIQDVSKALGLVNHELVLKDQCAMDTECSKDPEPLFNHPVKCRCNRTYHACCLLQAAHRAYENGRHFQCTCGYSLPYNRKASNNNGMNWWDVATNPPYGVQ